jgi:uncharacterized protein (TIGR04255 family)
MVGNRRTKCRQIRYHELKLSPVHQTGVGPDIDLRFQFRMPNQDYPAVMRRPQFVLDIDAYTQVAHPLQDSMNYMGSTHEHIQRLFEQSIADNLREVMHARSSRLSEQ